MTCCRDLPIRRSEGAYEAQPVEIAENKTAIPDSNLSARLIICHKEDSVHEAGLIAVVAATEISLQA